MRRLFLQILFLTIFFLNITIVAQNSDEVDLQALVSAQILEAKNGSKISVDETSTNNSKNVAFPNISSGVFNLLIFILSTIIILSLVVLRRVKIEQKIVSKQFKENIRLIREENLRKPIDYSLTPVRKGLLERIEISLGEEKITELARKLKIAKGELLLVNSIKKYGSETSVAR